MAEIKLGKDSNESIKISNLSKKRKDFLYAFFEKRDAEQAAIDAGYSVKTANKQSRNLMMLPEVKAIIQQRDDELAIAITKKLNITRNDLVLSYLEIRERALRRNQLSVAVKVNDSIAKMLGLNEPEKQMLMTLGKIQIEVVGDESKLDISDIEDTEIKND